jgi:hypothetical protein
MANPIEHGQRVSATTTGTASCTATIPAVTNGIIYITDISGSSSSSSGTITVASAGVVLWQDAVGADSYHHQFISYLVATKSQSVTVTTASGGTYAAANVSGFYITAASGN